MAKGDRDGASAGSGARLGGRAGGGRGEDGLWGLFWDRIDIPIGPPAVPYQELSVERSGEPSAAIRERVNRSRQVQLDRFAKRRGGFANAHMAPQDPRNVCKV